MLSPSIHSVCPQKQVLLEQDIKNSFAANNKRKSLVLQLIRDGNTQSLINPMKKWEQLEYKKVVDHQNSNDKCSSEEMLELCKAKLKDESILISRDIIRLGNTSESNGIHVMQWNILSEALGTYYDRFDTCSADELKWSKRLWKIIVEVLQYWPIDIICMQEVDIFDHLIEPLSKIGFGGIFVPKPNSPCNYIKNNSGPDGCAIFWRLDRIELIKYSKRVLRVYQYKTNQVALCATFRHKESGRPFCVATTHLKARKGPILSAFRNEQGKDLMKYLAKKCKNMPLVLTGDFNAEPNEAVYKTVSSKMVSAYKEGLRAEPLFTTWTKRESEREMKRTLDYIFYTKQHFKVESILSLDSKQLTKPIPNPSYPSDHLSLAAHLNFMDD